MCLLSYYPEGVLPDVSRIRCGARHNRDGHGFAIATGDGRIIRRRGLSPDEIIDKFEKSRREHPEGPAIFHSRIASSGVRQSVANCHPFHVGGDGKTVLAHNGILFDMAKGETRSDTRFWAERMIRDQGFTRFDNPKVVKALERWLGGRNKVAVITVNPKYQQQGYLLNEHAGEWTDDGEWHSNGSWKSYAGTYGGGGYVYTPSTYNWKKDPRWVKNDDGDGWHWDSTKALAAIEQKAADGKERLENADGRLVNKAGQRVCEICDAVDQIHFGVCVVCQSCEDCLEWGDDCMCYTPLSARAAERRAAHADDDDEMRAAASDALADILAECENPDDPDCDCAACQAAKRLIGDEAEDITRAAVLEGTPESTEPPAADSDNTLAGSRPRPSWRKSKGKAKAA